MAYIVMVTPLSLGDIPDRNGDILTTLHALSGKIQSIHPSTQIGSVACVIYFGADPLTAAIGG